MNSSQNQSKAWRFFEKQNNGQTVTCKLCGRSIKFHSSTTTMHQHLNSHHEKEVVEMERSIVHKDQEPRHQIIGKNDANDDLAIPLHYSVCGSIVNNSRRNRMKPKTLNQQLLCAALATLESTKKNTPTTEEYKYDDENDDSEGEEYYESREHNDDTFGNDLAQIMKH